MILIDADVVVYRCGWAGEKTKWSVDGEERENKKDALAYIEFLKENFGGEPELTSEIILEPLPNVLQMVRSALTNMIEQCKDFGEHKLYLTGEGNFRHEVATIKEYKGNRKDMRKPHWYDEIREYLVNYWGAEVVEGQEADDALGIHAWKDYNDTYYMSVLVSTDKDLNMIPGFHYDWVKGEAYYVEELEAMKNFYTQLLVGDATDNIPGIKGIGPKKAEVLLEGCDTEQLMHEKVWDAYYSIIGEPDEIYTDLMIKEIATLLWIRREPDEMWEPFKYKIGENNV